MAIKTENDLSPNAKSLWLKAVGMSEMRNFGYAISLLRSVLKEEPAFLEGRKWLRKAEIANTKGKKIVSVHGVDLCDESAQHREEESLAAIEAAEDILVSEPQSPQANNALRDAALAANLPEVATFALETLVDASPKDAKTLHELAKMYYGNGDNEKAVEIYARLTEINPADLEAVKKGKDAAARSSMSKGGWDEVSKSGGAKSYRDLIADKDAATSIEQQSRMMMSPEMIDQQINELYARAEQEPESIDIARKIAGLFEQREDFDSAIWWYSRASELAKDADPGLLRRVSDLTVKSMDAAIKGREEYLAAVPADDPAAEQYREELEQLKKQRALSLVDEARKRVERNPTDLQFRFDLGEQLMLAGEYKDAIPELQKARQNPNARLRAMNLLGQCYVQRGMLDLALKSFEDAKSEMLTMDATKKDIVYNLGLAYEKAGKPDKALECMKEIYEIDYGYKDVAPRVEGSYSRTASEDERASNK